MDDYQTSTVDGALGFVQLNFQSDSEDYDSSEEYEEDRDKFYEDDCNCSDPGCPCGGMKIGGL